MFDDRAHRQGRKERQGADQHDGSDQEGDERGALDLEGSGTGRNELLARQAARKRKDREEYIPVLQLSSNKALTKVDPDPNPYIQ